jgi:hypothetical protein
MNLEIGTEAAQFSEKEYINGIFVAVWRACPLAVVSFGSLSPSPLHSSLSLHRSSLCGVVVGGGGCEPNQTTAKKTWHAFSLCLAIKQGITTQSDEKI